MPVHEHRGVRSSQPAMLLEALKASQFVIASRMASRWGTRGRRGRGGAAAGRAGAAHVKARTAASSTRMQAAGSHAGDASVEALKTGQQTVRTVSIPVGLAARWQQGAGS